MKKWFEDNAKTIDRKELFDAVWTGNADILTKEIGTLLRMTTVSYTHLILKCMKKTIKF